MAWAIIHQKNQIYAMPRARLRWRTPPSEACITIVVVSVYAMRPMDTPRGSIGKKTIM